MNTKIFIGFLLLQNITKQVDVNDKTKNNDTNKFAVTFDKFT